LAGDGRIESKQPVQYIRDFRHLVVLEALHQRRIQSGNLRSYAAWVLLGAVIWVAYILIRP
jgi:hypothetical protein